MKVSEVTEMLSYIFSIQENRNDLGPVLFVGDA